jgi:hypothetical protein
MQGSFYARFLLDNFATVWKFLARFMQFYVRIMQDLCKSFITSFARSCKILEPYNNIKKFKKILSVHEFQM